MNALFRSEVIEAKRRRLYGNLIVRTPRTTVGVIWGMILLAVGGAAYALNADYTRWQVVDGYLYPDKGMGKITPSRPGVVTKLFVSDDQKVRLGQPLLEISIRDDGSIDDTMRVQMRDILSAQQESLRRQELLARQQSSMQLNQSRARLLLLRSQLQGLGSQISLQRQRVATLEQMIVALAETQARGFVSRRDYALREAEVIAAKQELSQLEGRADEVRASTLAIELEIGSGSLQRMVDSNNLERGVLQLDEQGQALNRDEKYVVTSPTDGVVTGLSARVGQSADDKITLGYIVPSDTSIVAVLLVPTSSAGFLKHGQEVRLEYEAFPYQQFGRHVAQITSISRSISPAGEPSGPVVPTEPTYRVLAKLKSQTVKTHSGQVPLGIGMLLRARIAARRQRLVDWLTEPLRGSIRSN